MVRATVYLQLDPDELLHIRPVHTRAVMRIESGSVHSHMMRIGFDVHWSSIQFRELITWAIIPKVV